MKQVIDNKLYDTEKSKLLYQFVKNVPETRYFIGKEYSVNCWRDTDLYKTAKGNYFIHIKQPNIDHNSATNYGERKEYIEQISYDEAKEIVQKLNVDKAIELFGEIEEA